MDLIRPYTSMSKMTQVSTSFSTLAVISKILLKSKCILLNRVQSLTNDDITVSKSLILSQNRFSLALFTRGKRRARTRWPYKRGHTQRPRSGNKCPGMEGEAGDKKVRARKRKRNLLSSNTGCFSRRLSAPRVEWHQFLSVNLAARKPAD